MNLTWSQVCARRLLRQGLLDPLPAGPADVAAALAAVHAQVLSAAELSVGLRLAGGSVAGVREALWTARSLVKTYGPRGTVHLLATADLPMWTGALSALPAGRNPFPDDVRLDSARTDEVVAAIGDALADAELTVDELTDAIVARTGPWAGDLVMEAFQGKWPRWRQAVGVAANRGALCYGPNRGRLITYTGPARWLPGFRSAEPEAALAGVVHRFLHGYGPATVAHFAQWLNVPKPWAAELFASLGDALEPVTVDGAPAWVNAGDTTAPETPPEGVRLLPYFDAYSVGCHPRDKVYPGRAAERALGNNQGGTFPVLLVDGVVAGVWHLRRSGRKSAVTVEPLGRLSAVRRRELAAQVDRIGEVLGGPATLEIGPVTVGGHA